MVTDIGLATRPRLLTASDLSEERDGAAALVWTGWAVVAIGWALRLREYLANRSLGIDEAFLALNLIEKSPRELLGRLAFDQAAPLAFLEAEQAAITLLGRSEYALRLIPLIASLLAVVLFYRVAQRVLTPGAALLAVTAFAFLDPLVLYAATTKQYALDVAAAVLILATAVLVDEGRIHRAELVAIGALGATVVWFSHAAVFGLAALSVLLLARVISARAWNLAPAVSAVIVVWGASFTVHFLISRTGTTDILRAFEGGDALEPTAGGSDWFVKTIDRIRYLAGLEETFSGQPAFAALDPWLNRGLTLLVVGVVVIGFGSVVRSNRAVGLMLALPPMLAVVASALGEYPLVGRTLLFTLPSVAICLAQGSWCLFRGSPRVLRAPLGLLAGASLAAVMWLSVTHAVQPRDSQELREALGELGENSRRGDALYMSHGAQFTLAYYSLCGCAPFDPATRWPFSIQVEAGDPVAVQPRSRDLIVGSDLKRADIMRLQGSRRAWFLLAELNAAERTDLIEQLEALGTKRYHFESSGPLPARASLFLFDLASSR